MGALNWRNLDDLARDTMLLAPKLRDVDAIVGIARSGVLPAAILATALHKPLAMCETADHGEGFVDKEGISIACGRRLRESPEDRTLRRVAVVDDSVLTGLTFRGVLSEHAGPDFIRACVYLQPGAEEHVDHFAMHLPAPRIFEWNLFGSELIKHSILDIDGVLCPDPPMMEDDRAAYEDYIASAPILNKPLFPVAAICTNRIEPYREVTENWLRDNGIEFGALHMAPFSTAEARRRMSTPADLKSAWYANHDAPGVLVESHDWIAEVVARNVGRPVISLQSRRCFE